MLRWIVSYTSSYMWSRLLLVFVLAPFSIGFQVVTWLSPAVPRVNEEGEKVTLEARTTFDPVTSNQQMQEADIRVIANAGDIAILKCHVMALSGKALNSSAANHVYAWRKFGKEAPIATILQNYPPRFDPTYSLRIDVIDGVNLRLSEVDETDTGMYECSRLCVEGGNRNCQDGKVLVALKVNTPPVLRDKSPSLTFVNDGDSVDLFCEVAGVPEPSHLWLKDGFQIFQSDRIQTSIVGVRKNVARLMIKRFKKNTDSAVYSCHFWNFVGNVSHHMKVIVPEKHWILSDNAFIMTSPRNTTAMEGSRIKFICLSHGFPLNASQRWFFNGQNVLTVSSLKQRTQTFSDGSLVISNIEKKDAGWYKCSPSNGLGRAPEAEAYLNVTYLPRVVNSPSKVYLARNLAGGLTCLVDANPPMNLIRWYRDNRPVDLSTHKHIRLSPDGVHLFLRPATVLDEGNYYCVPHSSLGQGEKSPTMQVLVKDPPYFVLRPRPIYQRQPTQSVTMACQADGDPKPIIIWRKAEGEFAVPSKLLRMEGNLTVVNLSKEDHGYYECVASSPVADVVASTLVIIELTTPHPPTNVSAVPSKDHVHLSWFPAYDGGYPLHYLVWYRPVSPNNSLPWSTMRTIFSNLTYITIHQLSQDTEYEFVVFSRNNLGEGLCSDVIQVRTRRTNVDGACLAECPITITTTPQPQHTSYHLDLSYQEGLKPPKPINLTAKFVKSSLVISWSVPSFSDTNDIHLPIHHFSLQYRTVGQWVSLVERLMGTTSYNWTTASRGAVYQFRVIAHSKLPMELKFVPGEYSDVFVFQTGDPMHSDSPVTDQTLGAVIAIFFVSGILIVIFFVFLKKLCSRIHREKSRKGAESNSHRFPANASDHECSSAMPETESLCKPVSKIKETPI